MNPKEQLSEAKRILRKIWNDDQFLSLHIGQTDIDLIRKICRTGLRDD